MRFSLLLGLLFAVPHLHAQTGVLGRWQDPTHNIIEIARCGDRFCATLLALSPQAPAHVDIHNPDPAQRTRPLCHLRIGSGFRLTDPSHAEDGQLYDPKSGHTYSGSMTASGDTLNLRGYIGFKLFGRSETWTRLPANTPSPACF